MLLCFLGKATISNDGATILKLLDVVHPAAKTLVDIARSQDAEVSLILPCSKQLGRRFLLGAFGIPLKLVKDERLSDKQIHICC